MRQATSQEPVTDSGHSLILESSESNGASSLKSAAMLGLALSVGASGALIPQTEASAAINPPAPSATTKAFSSDAQAAKSASTDTATQTEAQTNAQSGTSYHTVESGESLWQIAQHHRVGLSALKSANALAPETSIKVGQVLQVPAANAVAANPIGAAKTVQLATAIAGDAAGNATPAASLEIEIADASVQSAAQPSQPASAAEAATPVVTAYAPTPAVSNYQVQAGDTLRSIASSLGTTPEALVRANSLIDPNVIFVGATLVVPESQQATQPVAAKKEAQAAPTLLATQSERPQGATNEQLAYLRDTAARPGAARLIENMRSASPETPASVGGEEVTEQDLLGSTNNADPYVENLLEDVEDVRTQSVAVSEAEPVKIESDTASSTEETTTSRLLARGNPSDRVSRTNAAGSEPTAETEVASKPVSAIEADPDLLAAAPLSPDAYVPAQRSSAGQVVSPDMPILPSADEYLPEAPDYFDGYMWPTQGTITSGYGWRWGRMHRGIDVAGPIGTPVVAAAAGVVEDAGWNSGGYGNLVEIRHLDGSLTRYAHNNSLNVSTGQSVKQGQQIAEMGSTGYSTGPHLHFEVVQGGSAVNPVAYLPSR